MRHKLSKHKLLRHKLLTKHCSDSKILWETYLSFVFSYIAYAWPAFCDIPQSHIKKLIIIEKQAMRLCNISGPNILKERLDNICHRLINKIGNNCNHPLRCLFKINNNINYNIRHRRTLLPPLIKSSKILNTFIGFSNKS